MVGARLRPGMQADLDDSGSRIFYVPSNRKRKDRAEHQLCEEGGIQGRPLYGMSP